MDQVKFFKGCLPQILPGPLLNNLFQIMANESLVMMEILELEKEISTLKLGIPERNLNDESKTRMEIIKL